MSCQVVKKRYWAFVLYPESAPSDWIDQLAQFGVPAAVSPLHNMDCNPDGEVKKEHFHIILCYSGPTTLNSVKTVTDALNCPMPIPLEQVKGYYRYLTHKDNPEKAQYSEADIRCLNGFHVRDFCEITKSEVDKIKFDLRALCVEMNFLEYSDFIDFVAVNLSADDFSVAAGNTMFFNSYLKSRRGKFLDASSGS